MQFRSSQASWVLAQEKLAIAAWQRPCTSLSTCPRGASKTTGHRSATPSILTWSRIMQFIFLSPLEKKAMWALISVSWGDCHCHKGNRTGPSCEYLSAVLPAAIPTLADLHSGQWRLFWGRMWMYVSVCVYLVIWCN
jgi:hypothetical protein